MTTAHADHARNLYIGIVCALLSSIGFSGKTILIKLAYEYDVDSITLLALRMILAMPFFLALAWGARGEKVSLDKRDWLIVTGLGFIGYYVGSYLDFAGLQYISAGLGRLILYLYPTLVLILSAVWFKQPMRGRDLLSLGLCYSGIALVFSHDMQLGESAAHTALGAVLVFGSAATYAVYLVMGARMVQKLGSMRLTAYASIAASCFVIAHFMVTHGPGKLVVPVPVYGLSLTMAILSTVLPLWLMAEALKRIGANKASLVACIGPISTIVLASIFLGEPIGPAQIAGAALVLTGVMIMSLKAAAGN